MSQYVPTYRIVAEYREGEKRPWKWSVQQTEKRKDGEYWVPSYLEVWHSIQGEAKTRIEAERAARHAIVDLQMNAKREVVAQQQGFTLEFSGEVDE